MHQYRSTRAGRRRFAAVGLAAAMTVSGLVIATAPLATATSVAATAPQALNWKPCVGIPATPGVPASECATLTVPRDWDNPGEGEPLSIAISRVRATDPAHRKGILLTNPGGPGGPGVGLPDRLVRAHAKIATEYDLIGMDPRGVGESSRLFCDVSFYFSFSALLFDSRDDSPEAAEARANQSKAIADGCAKNPLTPFITTWQTVHDMDAIRAALGEDKLNYVGYSYGTWLGAKYAAVFPKKAGKVVLDSNTAWTDDLAQTWQAMPNAMQRRFNEQFVPWVARHPVFSKYIGTTPEQVTAYYEAGRAGYIAASNPLKFVGAALDNHVLQGLYTDKTFVNNGLMLAELKCYADSSDLIKVYTCLGDTISKVLKDLDRAGYPTSEAVAKVQAIAEAPLSHDSKTVADAFGSTGSPALDVELAAAKHDPAPDPFGINLPMDGTYFAIRCGDGGQWKSPAWWSNFRKGITPQNWLAGYQIGGTEVCPYWTTPTHELPNPDEHQLSKPIVLVQSEFDPATAYENATRNVAQHHNSRLISVQDFGTHGVYGIRGNGCVDDLVDGWLLNDVEPAESTVCGSAPLQHETVVYPVDGPVDSKQSARPAKIRPVNPQVEADLDSIIGNTH
jgi:pimeloyl-ACP methyl ester carboxylesterase